MGLGIGIGVTPPSEVTETGIEGTSTAENDSNSSPKTIPMTPVKWWAVLRFSRTNQMPAIRRIAAGNPNMRRRYSKAPMTDTPLCGDRTRYRPLR